MTKELTAEERGSAFLREYKELVEKYECDIVSAITFDSTGIRPKIQIVDKKIVGVGTAPTNEKLVEPKGSK